MHTPYYTLYVFSYNRLIILIEGRRDHNAMIIQNTYLRTKRSHIQKVAWIIIRFHLFYFLVFMINDYYIGFLIKRIRWGELKSIQVGGSLPFLTREPLVQLIKSHFRN
ncbi:hypothetical protein ACJX0J_019380, partial [Zea mays]